MWRFLLLASNCTWSWSLNSLHSLLIRVLMNTNTWLCSTLISDHWDPLQSRGLTPVVLQRLGRKNRAGVKKKNVVLLNIQNMQAHNFWIRRVGVYSTLLFLFLLLPLRSNSVQQAHCRIHQLLYQFLFNPRLRFLLSALHTWTPRRRNCRSSLISTCRLSALLGL